MKKSYLFCSLLLMPGFISAQIGINTQSPQATLDIRGSSVENPIADGVLVPRISGDSLRQKGALYDVAQHGVILYVTSADTEPQGKTSGVIQEGFYYYDSAVECWKSLGEGSAAAGIWQKQKVKSDDPIVSSIIPGEDIFHLGKLAIGFDGLSKFHNYFNDINNPSPVLYKSVYDLDVSGAFQFRKEMNGADGNTAWFTEALTNMEEYAVAVTDRSLLRGNVDRFLAGSNLANLSVLNKTALAPASPYYRMKTWGAFDDVRVPLFSFIFPEIAFNFRKSFSLNFENLNSNATRYFDFENNNTVTFGYVEGSINLQTLKIPNEGTAEDNYSRIFINKPTDGNSYIEITSVNRRENEPEQSSSQILVAGKDISFHFDGQGHSYIFPDKKPLSNQVLGTRDDSGKLEWITLESTEQVPVVNAVMAADGKNKLSPLEKRLTSHVLKISGGEGAESLKSFPVYMTDQQADADTDLPSGTFYKLSNSRAVYQKP